MVSGLLFLLFRSFRIALWSFIGGTFIDLDHIYDYVCYRHRDPLHKLNLKEFFDVFISCKLEKIYIFFHSWELLALILIAGALFPGIGAFLIPFGFGMAIHIVLDAYSNPSKLINYSLAVRFSYRFDGKKIYTFNNDRVGKSRKL